MQTAKKNAKVVEERLQAEVGLKRVIGPLPVDQYPQVQNSRFGVIPKNHQPDKWRMIDDLSHPKGNSVNDGIGAELCSLRYASVDDTIQTILRMGTCTQLAKFDIESAYRIVPVHPTDRLLLGMQLEGQLDTALPLA